MQRFYNHKTQYAVELLRLGCDFIQVSSQIAHFLDLPIPLCLVGPMLAVK
jgi:hypothetical protein